MNFNTHFLEHFKMKLSRLAYESMTLISLSFVLCLLPSLKAHAICSSPTANAGAMNYFSATSDIRYCNGTSWVSSKYGGVSIETTLKDLTPGKIFANAVTASGNYAYAVGTDLNGTFGLATINISTPSNPTIAGSYASVDPAGVAITTDDSYLYVISGSKLLIFSLATPSNPTLVGSLNNTNIGGSRIIVSGNYAYLVTSNKFVIINITTKTAPVISGSISNASINSNVGFTVSGNYAFVVSGYSPGYFLVLDITSKTSPSLITSISNSGLSYPSTLAIYGNYAYVGRGNSSSDQVAVVDITNKTAPSYLGPTNFTWIRDILISGNYAYFASKGGNLSSIDLSATGPLNIFELQSVPIGSWNQNFGSLAKSGNILVGVVPGASYIAILDLTPSNMVKAPEAASITSGSPNSPDEFHVVGSTAVITDSSGGFWTFDVSNPAAMTALATNSMNAFSTDSYYDGTYLYISLPNSSEIAIWDLSSPANPVLARRFQDNTHLSQTKTVQRSGNYVYATSYNGMSIYDATSISSMSFVGIETTSLSWPSRMRVFGNYVYVLDGTKLYIYDVTTKTAPTLLATLNSASLNNANDIAVSGNYAFIATFSGVVVVDVTTKSAPTVITTFSSAPSGDHIAISGSYAYVAGGAKFYVVDISTPATPVLKSTLTSGSLGVALSGTNAFRADSTLLGIRSYNISNPLAVTATSSIAFNGYYESTTQVALTGNYAVTVGSYNTLTVTDVSVPSNPVPIKMIIDTRLNQANSITTSGNYGYVAANSYFDIVDLTTPASASIIGSVNSASLSTSRDIKVSGNYAYVLKTNGFAVVDITTKTAPVVVGTLTNALLSNCWAMDVSGSYAYAVCQGSRALVIIDVSTPATPSVVGNFTSTSTLAGVNSVVVVGNYAYASESLVHIIDITNKTAPTLASTFNAIPSCGGCIPNALYFDGMGLMSSGSGGISYWDLTDPINPVMYGNAVQNSISASMSRFATDANVLVALGIDSLWVFGKGNYPAPRKASALYSTAPALSYAIAIQNSGNYSFALSGTTATLSVVDISNPASPSIAKTFFDKKLSNTNYFALSGNYIYALDPVNTYSLVVIDISNPLAPKILSTSSSYSSFGFASYPQISGNYLYLTKNGLKVFDITTRNNPQLIGSSSTTGSSNLTISGSNAYNCDTGGNLFTYNLTTPSAVTSTSFSHASLAGCQRVFVSGNYLYATTGSNGRFAVVDISTPTSPSFIGSVTDTTNLSNAVDIQVNGNSAYVTLSGGTITTVDITNKTSPVVSNAFTTTASRYASSWTSPYLISPNYLGGLDFIKISTVSTLGACSTAGTIDFITANKVFAYCDGSNFIPMGPSPGAGGAGCSTPTALPGAFNYNTTTNMMTYCDGSAWVKVGN